MLSLFEFEQKYISNTIPLLMFEDLVAGNNSRLKFASEMLHYLYSLGYFYLSMPPSTNEYYCPAMFHKKYVHLFNEALSEHPYLNYYLRANSVFEFGYNIDWFPKSDKFIQPIEALMFRPKQWNDFRGQHFPVKLRNFFNITEQIYHQIYDISMLLIDALEIGFDLRRGCLRKLFKNRVDGAIRFVKYHQPNPVSKQKKIVARASIPHVDKSFFSFNIGETRSGLVFINGKSRKVVAQKDNCLLITSGKFSASITAETNMPIRPFKHTVKNSTDRIVGLVFVSPEGELHNKPLSELPTLIK